MTLMTSWRESCWTSTASSRFSSVSQCSWNVLHLIMWLSSKDSENINLRQGWKIPHRLGLHRRNLRGRVVRGIPVPSLFGRRGTVPPLFRTKMWRICCPLLPTEAICGDYVTIKPFSAGALYRTPLGKFMTLVTDSRVGWGGEYLPIILPFRLETKGDSFSFWIGTPHFLDQS